jgi:hypothetical protein
VEVYSIVTIASLLHASRPLTFVALALVGAGACGVDKNSVLAPTNSSISIATQAPLVPINGSTSVTVQVTAANGVAVQDGTEILLAATRGRFDSPKVRTKSGAATATYHAHTEPGPVELQAVSDTAQGTTVLAITSAPVARVTITASPSMLPAGGGQVELKATVLAEGGDRVSGAPVTFVTNTGTLAPPLPVPSNAEGQATARLTASQAAVVRARVHVVESEALQIGIEVPIQLTVTAAPARPVVGQAVTFTITPSDLARTGTMSISFGDGDTDSIGSGAGVRTATHTYSTAGGYNVTAVFAPASGGESRQTIRLTVDPPAPPPPPPPPPSTPPTTPDDDDDPDVPFKLSDVTWLHTDVSRWAETSRITDVDITSSQICIEHTKAGRWPSRGGLEGNPWVFAQIGGKWYAGTYEWLREGQICKGITASNIGEHIKKAPLETWRPRSGELVGFMVSTLARTGQEASAERSNVVMVRWP